MESTNYHEFSPLVYLLAGSHQENRSLRLCLEDMGVSKIVSVVNMEHLIQELFHGPDIVLINAELKDPLIPGIIRKVKAQNPKTHLVFLIDHENHLQIIDLLKFGAFDFVAKDMQFAQKLIRIVNTVVRLKQNTV